MKAPWKYLADLMSRRRPQTGRGSHSKLIELEANRAKLQLASPERMPVPAVKSPAVSEPTVTPTSKHEAREPEVTQSLVAKQPAAELDRPLDADTDTLLPQVNVAPETRAPSVAASNDTAAAVPSQPDGFFGDLANMDEEIKRLRRQLSEKLQSQNDQLRMMLERFDRS